MSFVTVDNITDQVLAVMAKTPDPRLREITTALALACADPRGQAYRCRV
jgi:hypothetical protein